MKIKKSYEYIIIGSGFGGAFAAHNLAKAGKEVLIIERGVWVKRDDSCWDEKKLHLVDPLYRGMTPYRVDQKEGALLEDWPDDTVGGMSTFYGAASFRMREEDFEGSPLPGTSEKNRESAWPVRYRELSPYYDEAERLLGVAGFRGEDITEPRRESDFPQPPPDRLSLPSRKVRDAALQLGLHPFHIPLAINFNGACGKGKCILCSTCDHYLCKIEAKNDLSVVVLPDALRNGAILLSDTRAIHIQISRSRVASVDLINQLTGEMFTIATKNLILSAGALATPHLLLSSGIDSHTPAGSLIGRYLMRHSNGVVSGLFPFRTNPDRMFQKQMAIPDFYHGDPQKSEPPAGPWGLIQDISSIGKGVIKANSPMGLKNIAALVSDFLINLLCIAEDIPQHENRVTIAPARRDRFGLPALMVHHRYHPRDLEVRDALYRQAKRVLRKAGALAFYTLPIETFSHALGTCRAGKNRKTSVLDPECRVWGIRNLTVLDASFMPTGGSVNPSLTIAANSLRVSRMLAGK